MPRYEWLQEHVNFLEKRIDAVAYDTQRLVLAIDRIATSAMEQGRALQRIATALEALVHETREGQAKLPKKRG